MLNPSTADEAGPDPTVRRCLTFSAGWGYRATEVVNIFALRSTDPQALYREPDPVGPENDAHILEAATGADLVVCAWGARGAYLSRGRTVLEALYQVCHPHALRLTRDGHPGHPLYLPASLEPRLIPCPP
jgi:hypothetical protein